MFAPGCRLSWKDTDDAIISKDLDGRITTWNKGAGKYLGYSQEEAVGRPITMLIPRIASARTQIFSGDCATAKGSIISRRFELPKTVRKCPSP